MQHWKNWHFIKKAMSFRNSKGSVTCICRSDVTTDCNPVRQKMHVQFFFLPAVDVFQSDSCDTHGSVIGVTSAVLWTVVLSLSQQQRPHRLFVKEAFLWCVFIDISCIVHVSFCFFHSYGALVWILVLLAVFVLCSHVIHWII